MAQIQIVVDSTAYFTKEEIKKYDLRVVPLHVTFGDESEPEGFPGEFEDFYNRLVTSSEFPRTSQPSIEAFAQVFEEAVKDGKEVITLVLSSKVSGTFNSASVAAQMVGQDKISVIDSTTAVGNFKALAKRALELSEKGFGRQEIVNIINEEKLRTAVSLTVDNLEYLKRGGRLTSAQAFIGNMLNVKPIIGLIDGALEPIGKVRGKKKAIEHMISIIPDHVKEVTVCHILDEEEAVRVKELIEERFKGIKVYMDIIGPVIGSHLGPKAIGICTRW